MNAKGAALGGEDKLITEPKDRAHIIAIYENPEEDIILFNCYMNTESMNLQIGEDTQLTHGFFYRKTDFLFSAAQEYTALNDNEVIPPPQY